MLTEDKCSVPELCSGAWQTIKSMDKKLRENENRRKLWEEKLTVQLWQYCWSYAYWQYYTDTETGRRHSRWRGVQSRVHLTAAHWHNEKNSPVLRDGTAVMKKAEVIIKRASPAQDMHSENADCIRPPDKTTAAEGNRPAKAVCSMNTARRQDKRTAVLWKGRIWMQTSFCWCITEKRWGEGICHTLFWEKLAEKCRKNVRYMTEYPEGQLNQEGPLLWNTFIPDRADRKW